MATDCKGSASSNHARHCKLSKGHLTDDGKPHPDTAVLCSAHPANISKAITPRDHMSAAGWALTAFSPRASAATNCSRQQESDVRLLANCWATQPANLMQQSRRACSSLAGQP